MDRWNDEQLRQAAALILARAPVAGTDKVGRRQFESELGPELQTIARKVHAGTYRFTRYRSVLRTKGPGKPPREISIPTYRDRVTLRMLLSILQTGFAGSIDRSIANEKVRFIRSTLANQGWHSNTQISRIDITNFFGSLSHKRLRTRLNVFAPEIQRLIMAAVQTTSGRSLRTLGIPQGVSISSALADEYVWDIQTAIEGFGCTLVRHVDDILLVGGSAHAAGQRVRQYLESIQLRTNEEKSLDCVLGTGFDYLGYYFSTRGLSVSEGSRRRFLGSVEKIVGRFRARNNGYSRFLMTPQLRRDTFFREINNRITGVLCRARQFGWVIYFAESRDVAILKAMDSHIREIVGRVPELRSELPKLKSLVRTAYRFRFARTDGYIRNYDLIRSDRERRIELIRSGFAPESQVTPMSPEDVEALYERRLDDLVRDLERDTGVSS